VKWIHNSNMTSFQSREVIDCMIDFRICSDKFLLNVTAKRLQSVLDITLCGSLSKLINYSPKDHTGYNNQEILSLHDGMMTLMLRSKNTEIAVYPQNRPTVYASSPRQLNLVWWFANFSLSFHWSNSFG
jgi:hypothetical protein